MNLCMIYQAEFPPNERIEKEAKALMQAGHRVSVVCNNYGSFDKSMEKVNGAAVYRVQPTFDNDYLNKVLKFPIFCNPLWLLKIWQVIRKDRIEALHVVDIPLSLGVIALAKLFRLPVVLDMWENYPEALKGWGKVDWKYFVFKNYIVARWVEMLTVRLVDRIITVVEEQRDRLISEGIPAERIAVVTNSVDLDDFLSYDLKNNTLSDRYAASYVLLYVGGINIERGLDDVIKACKYVISTIPHLKVIIAGKGPYEAYLKELAVREGVAQYIDFIGWITFSAIPAYIVQSDLCLVPHVNNDFINTTIPNKIFQYMSFAKPVLVSNARPLARIVREGNCGFVFESGNARDLAQKIIAASRSEQIITLGNNGKALVHKKYNWAVTSKTLIELYRGLI